MKRKSTRWWLPCALAAASLLWALAALAEEYRVGPGDILTVKVYGETELSKDYEVFSDGTVRFPWIRNVEVRGLSTREIEDTLEKLLSPDYLVDPQIAVTVKQFESKKVYVLGAVKNPGLYGLKGPTTLLEAISMAGGISEQGGKSFTLVRGGDLEKPDAIQKLVAGQGNAQSIEDFTKEQKQVQVFKIDGYALLDQGDLTQNMPLEHGDIVSVLKTQFVFFDGEVKKPGPVNYEEGLTLLRALSLAGGATNLASNRVVITRTQNGKTETIKVNLRDIANDPSRDLAVFPGDVVRVKRSLL